MKITILGINYAPEPTGNAPYTTSLAQGLVDAGHNVHVITGYPHYPEWKLMQGYSGWTSRREAEGLRITRCRHYIPKSPSAVSRLHMELSFGLRLLFIDWAKPDVVLVVSPALFSSALAILRVRLSRKRPAVGLWVQDLYSRGVVETGTGNKTVGGLMGLLESVILRSADGVVVIHERFRQYIEQSLRVPADKTRVIRNWTHLPDSAASVSSETRNKLGWSSDDVVVLHAGNMGKKQGLENVIAAAVLAEQRQSSLKFVLLGDGNQRKRLEQLAGNIRNLQFIDPLGSADFQEALTAADILLVNELPGLRDMAVPSKLTSYFSTGRPVLAATDRDSVTASEIRASGGGVIIDPADPVALVTEAEALARDLDKSRSLGANGQRFRNETLSEAAAIEHYDGFITSLASSRGR